MTAAEDEQTRLRVELRAICDSLNDKRGTGGQTKLARMIGRSPRTMRNKISGKSPITQADELAIRQALVLESRRKACPPRT
jgi:hypothetical protein